MLAIDTNIVVRYLTADHPEQSPKAKALINSQDVFVCTTVLLETEWVLRSVYGFAPADIVKALAAFAGLPRVTLEDAALAATALRWIRGCPALGEGARLRRVRKLRPAACEGGQGSLRH